jgi:ribonucleoside-diphosphate reductase alpha chain
MTSALLRNGIPVNHIVNIISGLNFRQESINSWRNGVCRALKKFIQDGTRQKGVECPNCHQKDTMEFKEGCLTCSNCGYAKCGN